MQATHEVIVNFKHYQMTQAQIDMCERVVDPVTKEVYYKVKSTSTRDLVYVVRYLKTLGKLVCTCPAGLVATCWHRRAAVVKERLFKQELRAQYDAARHEIEATAEYRMEVAEVSAKQSLATYCAALKEAAGAGDEAAKRELKALKRYGLKAYDSEPFRLLM